MHTHRVDVFNRTNHDEIVRDVAHHLEFELLPADDRLLDQNFVDGAHIEAAAGELPELLYVVGDATSHATKRERGSNDCGKADVVDDDERLVEIRRHAAFRHLDADLRHRVAEQQAIFGNLDGVDLRANQLDVVFFQRAALV